MPEQPRHCIVAIVPCNDIEASTAFYSRLGLPCTAIMGAIVFSPTEKAGFSIYPASRRKDG